MSGEGGWAERTALGVVVEAIMDLFALLGLARHFSVSRLDAFFLHSQGSVNIVQFVVKSTSIADRIPVGISPPQGGGGRLAVSTGSACSSSCRQPPLGLDEGPVLPIHFMVEPACVTQVVPRAVSPPQGCGRGPAVYTLPAFCA